MLSVTSTGFARWWRRASRGGRSESPFGSTSRRFFAGRLVDPNGLSLLPRRPGGPARRQRRAPLIIPYRLRGTPNCHEPSILACCLRGSSWSSCSQSQGRGPRLSAKPLVHCSARRVVVSSCRRVDRRRRRGRRTALISLRGQSPAWISGLARLFAASALLNRPPSPAVRSR